MIFLAATLPAIATAAPALAGALTVSFSTKTIDVARGHQRNIALLLSNSSSAAVSGIAVRFIADDGIEAKTSEPFPVRLRAGASRAVIVTIEKVDEPPGTTTVGALVRYTTGKGTKKRWHSAVAQLAVTSPAAATPRVAPIAVSASPGRDDLIQYQSTDMFFTISNSTGRTQMLDAVVVRYPSFLDVDYVSQDATPVDGKDGTLTIADLTSLGPGDAAVVQLTLKADQPLQPGNALVALSVRATDQVDQSKATVVGTQKINFSVLGESGVLDVLAVPGLLFVPGLVFVVVLWALWTCVLPRRTFSIAAGLGVEGKVVMWVFALLPSLAFPFIYPVVTDLVGPRRDYRKAYGLDDILYVWMLAAGTAFALWSIVLLIRFVWIVLYVPVEGQRPRRLLAKFAFRLFNRSLDRGSAVSGTDLVVILRPRVGDKALVSPLIQYTTGNLSAADVGKIEAHIPNHPLRLWLLLLRRRSQTSLFYGSTTQLREPTLVEPSTLVGASNDPIVRAET